MTCDKCKKHGFVRLRNIGNMVWACSDCVPRTHKKEILWGVNPTVYFKWYYKNGGNVSANRVEEYKRRCLAPHGNGEVVMRTKFGRVTDRLAVNY